jgi:aminopeptidase N
MEKYAKIVPTKTSPDMKNKLIFFFLFIGNVLFAQANFNWQRTFTHADSLRGSLRPERTCYDVTFYHLDIKFDIDQRFINGYNDIEFRVVQDFNRLQLDLFENMAILKVEYQGKEMPFVREANAFFVTLPPQTKGTLSKIRVYYEGNPIVAQHAPWDGGFVFSKDLEGKPWIGVACEGIGASLWWPNKDHLSDEPDSMAISIAVPTGLSCVCNGRLRSRDTLSDGFTRFNWFVSYPINNYNVTFNIANYTHFSDIYTASDNQKLNLDYYVLPYNLEKAKKQFEQVKKMLEAYEYYFDKYPFWRDGYKLVETSYLGMEHQSAIAYGNKYMRGYLGGGIPQNMKWDYIVIHESGHEYFGNSISSNDHADMWLHESFTTYMEALYVEYTLGRSEVTNYLNYQSSNIANLQPIIGPRGVNFDEWAASDHYYKGAAILHTLRKAIGDDVVWFGLLKSFYQKYKYHNISNEDFFNYVNTYTKQNFNSFFAQYLFYPNLPKLEYKTTKKRGKYQLKYRWKTDVTNFTMPIEIEDAGQVRRIFPIDTWKTLKLKSETLSDFSISREFLVQRQGEEF